MTSSPLRKLLETLRVAWEPRKSLDWHGQVKDRVSACGSRPDLYAFVDQ